MGLPSTQSIISQIEEGITIFDKTKLTCLATDWSKKGIGYWLQQKHCCCNSSEPLCCADGWKITLTGGRFTNKGKLLSNCWRSISCCRLPRKDKIFHLGLLKSHHQHRPQATPEYLWRKIVKWYPQLPPQRFQRDDLAIQIQDHSYPGIKEYHTKCFFRVFRDILSAVHLRTQRMKPT